MQQDETANTISVVIDGTGETHFHAPSPLAVQALPTVHACGYNKYGPKTRVARNHHTGFLILCIEEGAMWFEVNERRVEAHSGQITWFDLGQPHAYGTDGGRLTAYWARLGGVPVVQLYGACRANQQPVFDCSKEVFRKVRRGLAALVDQFHRPTTPFEPHLGRVVYNFLSELLISRWDETPGWGTPPSPAVSGPIQQMVKYIEEHACELITLDDLAKNVYCSKFHLSRRFSRETGYTVRQYLNLCRITKAQKLLAQSDLTVTQIADRIGFSSSSYFATCFKKMIGCTPTEYRTRVATGATTP